MKTKNKCLFCGNETNQVIENNFICPCCETKLLNALLKRNTPRVVKSVFVKEKFKF